MSAVPSAVAEKKLEQSARQSTATGARYSVFTIILVAVALTATAAGGCFYFVRGGKLTAPPASRPLRCVS